MEEKKEGKKDGNEHAYHLSVFLFMGILFLGLLAFTCEKSRAEKNAGAAVERDGKGNIVMNVPEFYQWDEEWGKNPYAYGTIADSGCGPTCLSMVTVYYTGNTKKTPDWMAKYSTKHGHVYGSKTAWTLMTEGADDLGLHVKQIPIEEKAMKKEIQKGHLMICSMSPGDFTRGGHFILLTGYENGEYHVNDPNSMENTDKTWSYERIHGQIKNIWAYWK